MTYAKSDARDEKEPGLVPLLRATNIGPPLDFDACVHVPARCVSDEQRLRPGDLVIAASSGSKSVVGKAALLRHEWQGTFGAFCLVLRPAPEGVLPSYLAWFLQSSEYRRAVSELSSGVNINNLRAADIKSLSMPVAPLAEQHRIVEALDAQFTRLDAAAATLERVRVGLERYRAAVLHAAFEDRSDWTFVSGRDAFEFVTSGSRGWARYYADSGPWFIRIGNLVRGDIRLDTTSPQHVSPPTGAEGMRTQVRPGDVLFSITAEIGLVGLVPEDVGRAYVNQHIALARPKARVNQRFLAWYFVSPSGQRELRERMRGATKVGLGLNDIRDARIPQAPPEVQVAVVDQIERVLSVLDRVDEQVEAQLARLARLRQSLLRTAFEGRLVPQDPRDEPASALLDRIRASRAATPPTRKRSSSRPPR